MGDRRTVLMNIGLLERELGSVTYRMAEGETGLDGHRDALLARLREEHARLERQ